MKELTQSRLKELLEYNPDTGIFIWLENRGGHKTKGKIAGWVDTNGYRIISVYSQDLKAHRLAFLYMEGEIPKEVDHINHIRNDNRWVNLRKVRRIDNGQNQSMSIANTSGITGVYWCKRTKKWFASIRVNQHNKFQGYFSSIEDAKRARLKAEIKFGFHPNHGR